MKPRILGLVLARGGSKRIPGKNIKDFLGKPLIAWSIEAGLKSRVLNRLIISTDDTEIANIGRKYGAEIPFMRPAELASDTATSDDTIKHALEWLKDNERYEADWIFLLEPTAPAKQAFHLQDIAKIIKEKQNFDSIVGISEFPAQYTHIMQVKLNENGLIHRAYDEELLKNFPKSSREIPKSYLPNPQVYAFKSSNLFKGNGSIWGDSTYGYLMDSKFYIDIDTPEDWVVAEEKLRKIIEENKDSLN